MRQRVRSCEEASRVATRRSRQGVDTVEQGRPGLKDWSNWGRFLLADKRKGRTKSSPIGDHREPLPLFLLDADRFMSNIKQNTCSQCVGQRCSRWSPLLSHRSLCQRVHPSRGSRCNLFGPRHGVGKPFQGSVELWWVISSRLVARTIAASVRSREGNQTISVRTDTQAGCELRHV